MQVLNLIKMVFSCVGIGLTNMSRGLKWFCFIKFSKIKIIKILLKFKISI